MTTNLVMRDWMYISDTNSEMFHFRMQLLGNLSENQFKYLIDIIGH